MKIPKFIFDLCEPSPLEIKLLRAYILYNKKAVPPSCSRDFGIYSAHISSHWKYILSIQLSPHRLEALELNSFPNSLSVKHIGVLLPLRCRIIIYTRTLYVHRAKYNGSIHWIIRDGTNTCTFDVQ